ncbi:MAG: hypothetical protein EA401_07105 [Planctomycetota bacterium]|nr:MAG: hypothetical protein EA401_07105 [Planctomycetota bacterium]
MKKLLGNMDFYESSLDDAIELPAHLTHIILDHINEGEHPLLTAVTTDHARRYAYTSHESHRLLGEILSLLEYAYPDRYALSVMIQLCRKIHGIVESGSELKLVLD